MYNKEDLIASFTTEGEILKHLVSKIPADKYDRKPGEHSRTFRELLEYIIRMGTAPIALIEQGYSPELMKKLRIEAEEKDVENNFVAALDNQLKEISDYLNATTLEHLEETIDIFGVQKSRKHFFLEIAIKNFPAYRMQLFQYLKVGLGMSALNTSNLRLGKDSE